MGGRSSFSRSLFSRLRQMIDNHPLCGGFNVVTTAAVVPKLDLWELNIFPLFFISFVPINLLSCWPREWNALYLIYY